MAKFTCPNCIASYDKKKILFVCPSCNEVASRMVYESRKVKCMQEGCGGYATLRICPLCGFVIPQTVLDTDNLPFSIVGVATSGKTNYITVMLHELQRISGIRLALAHQTHETHEHQYENYKRIYEQHIPPEATASGNAKAQIWSIKNLDRRSKNSVKTYTFTIFDGAGEDHENMDSTTNLVNYIKASEAILLTVDPLILSSIKNGSAVDPDVRRMSLGGEVHAGGDAISVINRVADYIKTARGIRVDRKLDIPVAVILTKFDTLLDHPSFGPQALVRSGSLNIRHGKVDLDATRQINDEIRHWLMAIGEMAFINALEANFREFYFFAVSSYGAPPTMDGKIPEKISPHRVLDPLLWLFKRARFLD